MKCPTCGQETPKRSEARLLEEIKELELRNYVERTRADSYQAVTRDSFAIAALQGIIANVLTHKQIIEQGNGLDDICDITAKAAYKYADAMLEARK